MRNEIFYLPHPKTFEQKSIVEFLVNNNKSFTFYRVELALGNITSLCKELEFQMSYHYQPVLVDCPKDLVKYVPEGVIIVENNTDKAMIYGVSAVVNRHPHTAAELAADMARKLTVSTLLNKHNDKLIMHVAREEFLMVGDEEELSQLNGYLEKGEICGKTFCVKLPKLSTNIKTRAAYAYARWWAQIYLNEKGKIFPISTGEMDTSSHVFLYGPMVYYEGNKDVVECMKTKLCNGNGIVTDTYIYTLYNSIHDDFVDEYKKVFKTYNKDYKK